MFRIFVVLVVFLTSLTCRAVVAADFSGYLQTCAEIQNKKLNFSLRKLSLKLTDENLELETDLANDFRLIHGNLTAIYADQKFSFGKFLDPLGFQFPPANKLVPLEYPKASAYPFGLGLRWIGNLQNVTYRFAITQGEDDAKNFSGRVTYKQRYNFLTGALSSQVKIGKEKEFSRRIYGFDASAQTKLFSLSGGYNYLQEKVIKRAWWVLSSSPVNSHLTIFSQLQGWRTDGKENEVDLTVGVNLLIEERLMLRHNLIFPVRTKEASTRILLALQQEF